MGVGYKCICDNCGYHIELLLGIGFRFPETQKEVKKKALNGEFGIELKGLLERHSNGVIDSEYAAQVCKLCGNIEETQNLSMYLPKQRLRTDLSEYDELFFKHDYKLFKRFSHKCSKCGGQADLIDIDKERHILSEL